MMAIVNDVRSVNRSMNESQHDLKHPLKLFKYFA